MWDVSQDSSSVLWSTSLLLSHYSYTTKSSKSGRWRRVWAQKGLASSAFRVTAQKPLKKKGLYVGFRVPGSRQNNSSFISASPTRLTMSTVNCLSTAAADSFDYVVVGGGTAGCLVASRLAEYLPKKRILLIEGGPSDLNDQKVADIREWIALLGTEYDYDYPITEQYRGRRI